MAFKVPVAVLALLLMRGDAKKLVLYDDSEGEDLLKIEKIDIGPAQRCHSFTQLGHGVTQAEWSGLQRNAKIVFFKELGCTGDYMMKDAGEDTEISFYGTKFSENVSSLMLWESSIYPTRGIVDQARAPQWMAYYYDY